MGIIVWGWSIIDCDLRWEGNAGCCQGDSGVTGVDAAAIDARKLILSCTARCCLSIFVVVLCDDGKLNIDIDSFENNLFDVCCCCFCCWLNWISASSIDDDVDDEADDDDWRFVDDNFVVDGFVGAKSLWPLLKNEFDEVNRWLGVASPSVLIWSASINFVFDVGLVVWLLISSDEKVCFVVERLLGRNVLAFELVIVDEEGVFVEKIWLDDDE